MAVPHSLHLLTEPITIPCKRNPAKTLREPKNSGAQDRNQVTNFFLHHTLAGDGASHLVWNPIAEVGPLVATEFIERKRQRYQIAISTGLN
jgi:hypothetical protein